MAKNKTNRKTQFKEPDPFVVLFGKINLFLKQHLKQFGLGITLIVVLVVGIGSFRYIVRVKEEKASFIFSQLVEKYESSRTKDGEEKALELVKADFTQLIKTYGGYSAGRLSDAYFANILFNSGDFDSAIEHYISAMKTLKGAPIIQSAILNGLGYTYLAKKDGESAAIYFEQLVNGKDFPSKDMALFNLARIYEAKGDIEKSKGFYNQLISDYPDSIFFEIVKEKIAG